MRTKPRRALLLAVPVLVLLVYDGSSMYLAHSEEHKTPRNPETGIAVGAEAFNLGPEDAPGVVLFVHGFVGGSNNFAQVPETLAAAGWRVRALRLPGHGTSPRDFARTTSAELLGAVRDEVSLLKEQYPRIILVGHSMGGALCTLIAAEIPVDGLVLAAPYFGVTHRWYYGLRPETWTRLSAPLVPYVYKGKLFLQVNKKESKDQIYSYDWIPGKGMKTLVEIGELANRPEVLKEVRCPVLHLHAPGDVAASFESARKAVEQMGSTQKAFVSLPKSNHHIFWDYDAEAVEEAIVTFVDETFLP